MNPDELVWMEKHLPNGTEWWFIYPSPPDDFESYVAQVFFLPPVPPEKPDVYVAWIGVKEPWQRKGLATMMVDRIAERYHCTVDFGVTTVDGEALRDAYHARHG